MDRRVFLETVSLASLSTFLPAVIWGEEAAAAEIPADTKLRTLLDQFFYQSVEESPESASSLGLDKGERAYLKSKLDDYSTAGKFNRLAAARQRLYMLRALGKDSLSPAAQVDFDVVEYQLANIVASGEQFSYGAVGGRYAPYVISQLTGPYQTVPDFLDSQHKIETAADAESYLARLEGFAVALDQSLARQTEDAAIGVIAPDFALDTALAQLKALRSKSVEQTVMVTSLVRRAGAAKLTGDYGSRATAIVNQKIFPSLDRQIEAVTHWRSQAVSDAGVWRLPQGEAYYAGALHTSTTTELSPAAIHELGLTQVAEITNRINDILRKEGRTTGTVGERLVALNNEPAQLYANDDSGRAALLAQLNSQIEAMYKRLPKAFATLPKALVSVKRVPEFIQDGAANGYYQGAALDGSRPAAYYINLKDTHDWPKFSLPTLTFHEAVPGHHLQISLSQESTAIPLIRKRSPFSAYTEGWALYAEQLADELGFYKGDPLGRVGYLQSFLFRAARLVVDTGLHFKRWTRLQATDYLTQTTGFARPRAQREIDRYCVWPGQACSYKVGHTSWVRLRDHAREQLGTRFDLKAFHAVLLQGAVPLVVLDKLVNQWIASQKV